MHLERGLMPWCQTATVAPNAAAWCDWRNTTLAMMYDFIGDFLYHYWRNATAANIFSWFSWTQGLARLFAQCQLANCASVEVELPTGFILKNCKPIGLALVLPPSTSVELFRTTRVCASYLPVLRLRTHLIARQGASSLALRGVYLGVPFILEFDINDSNNTSEEWDHLASLDVVRAGYGGMLPIPSYYGLFESSVGRFSVPSDNGIDLAYNRSELAVVGPLAYAALQQLGEYVEPMDVAHRTMVWDGERITIIDFVQPACEDEDGY